MRVRVALGWAVLASIALAGCFGASPPAVPQDPATNVTAGGPLFAPFTPPVPSFDFSTLVDPDHEAHEVPLLHEDGYGVKLVGHTSVGAVLPQGMRGSITQIDAFNGTVAVAGMDQGPAFVLVDVTDPAKPRPISAVGSAADGMTVRLSKHDGKYLFYGCQVLGPPNTIPVAAVKGDCRNPEAVHAPGNPPAGVSVFNLTDPAHPVLMDFVETKNTHNLQTAYINGSDYVFSVSGSVDVFKFDRAAGKLKPVAQVEGYHDVTVVKHPLTGAWLLYAGAQGRGQQLVIYNVTNPESPSEVLKPGDWKDGTAWHDQVAFPQLVDGRALLAVAGEVIVGTPSALGAGVPPFVGGGLAKVTIIDVTDPAHAAKLGTWSPPFDPKLPWATYVFSPHEMAATPQGQLAVSWYHGGVWVIDLSTKERQASPVTLAGYQPHEGIDILPSTFLQTPLPHVPFVWGAAWDHRGYLLVPDMHTGVYVLEPEWGLHPAIDSGA